MKNIASMLEPALIQPARIIGPVGWVGHIPFASWILAKHNPAIFVELGTHSGNSYSAFCQTVQEHGLNTKCYAVDTWQGDEQAGHYDDEVFKEISEYNNNNYKTFSQLLRMTFNEAQSCFSDGSIDLLHIDGLHTYEAVKHDFETWLPKLSERGVVLFHDTNVREDGFGVWKLWEELCEKQPSIHFEHAHGLGVLFVGKNIAAEILEALVTYQADAQTAKKLFAYLGQRITQQFELSILNQAVAQRDDVVANLWQAVAQRDENIVNLNQAITQAITQRDDVIANLWQAITQRDDVIANLWQAVAQRDAQIVAHGETIQKIYNSRSWLLSKPLRLLAQLLRTSVK